MEPAAAAPVVVQAPPGILAHPGMEQLQMHMGLALAADPMLQQQHNNAEAGRISYDTNEDMGQQLGHYQHSSSGGSSALLGRKHAPDRRPLRFWQPFNDWWRTELEQLGRRPTSQEIGEWYGQSADSVWGDSKPSLQETRVHAKCLRSLPLVRDYFRNYRAKKKGKGGDGLDGTEEGGDTEDGNDNATGRRRRNNGANSRKRDYSMHSQEDLNDPASVAAAVAAAGMAGMDPMEIMQMQQQALMLPGQFWAGMEGCTEEEYARAVMMQQQMHTALLQQQMAAAAAAVAAQQFTGQQFGVFPGHDDDDDEEDTEPGDGEGEAAAASAPADAGPPEVASSHLAAPAATPAQQQQQQQQQQSEAAAASGTAEDGVQPAALQVPGIEPAGLQTAAAFAEQKRHGSTLVLCDEQQPDRSGSAAHQPEQELNEDAAAAAANTVNAMQDGLVTYPPSVDPGTCHNAVQHDSGGMAALESMREALDPSSAVHGLDGAQPGMPDAHRTSSSTSSHGQPSSSHVCTSPANMPDADMQDATADARVDEDVADPLACIAAAVAATAAAAATKAGNQLGELEVPVGMHAGALMQPRHAAGAVVNGVMAELAAMSTPLRQVQQQQHDEAEVARPPEHDEVALLDDEQLQGLSNQALLAHVKQAQEELCSKRELLKRSFDQLRRTQERLGRRERKLAKEQQKCRQYQQALTAWQASLAPVADAAQMQQQQQELFAAHQMAQMAMAAQAAAAAAAAQGTTVQQQQHHR